MRTVQRKHSKFIPDCSRDFWKLGSGFKDWECFHIIEVTTVIFTYQMLMYVCMHVSTAQRKNVERTP